MRLAPITAVLVATALPLAAQEASKTVLNPPTLPDATQFGYSQATIVGPDVRLLHVAGQVGHAPDGENGFEAQVDRAMANLATALDEAGADFADVAKITLLVVDHDAAKLAYLGEARIAAFGDTPPASTLIPVTRLYAPGVLFEIDAVAVLPAE